MKRLVEEYGLIIVVICLLLLMLVFFSGGLGDSALKSSESSVGKMNDMISNVDGHKTARISKTENYIGNYADIDGDGTVDGVIFADLAFSKAGSWGTGYFGDYSYSSISISDLKDYYVSQDQYTDKLAGAARVLSPISNSVGAERFYVIALEDIEATNWYYSLTSDSIGWATNTSFGSGNSNTQTVLQGWESKSFGEHNTGPKFKDLWEKIQNKIATGWFVPSRAEIAAFADNLGITTKNLQSHGLGAYYWTSSQYSGRAIHVIYLSSGYISNLMNTSVAKTRLITTF